MVVDVVVGRTVDIAVGPVGAVDAVKAVNAGRVRNKRFASAIRVRALSKERGLIGGSNPTLDTGLDTEGTVNGVVGVCVPGVLGDADNPPGATDGFAMGSGVTTGVGAARGAFDPAVGAAGVAWEVAVFGVGGGGTGTPTMRGRVSCGVGAGGFVDCVCAEGGMSKIAISSNIRRNDCLSI